MRHIIICCILLGISHLQGQVPLDYYLPKGTNYNKNIPTPAEVLGYQIGEWHVSHDQLLSYVTTLAEVSDRVQLTQYAKSYQDRSLVYLTITSPNNQSNIDQIRSDHLSLSNPTQNNSTNLAKQPVVIYQGYSIHGNESSGANAALLMAYHLAAAEDPWTQSLLDEAIILLDPCLNPDGFHRFSTWVNNHKSKNLVSDPNSREFREVWPGGRTNHYWFDLNRDWLLLQHPESRGRLEVFHQWKPNILTDHHEMGSHSTFFFQPGVPSRVNPNIPPRNQELCEHISVFHAAALDEIGSEYFTKKNYDDFYLGKGSTYPDVNACIGILFEQASSRGHLQETKNGLLSFPFTIRNQVVTSISTLKAGKEMRKELLEFQESFYPKAIALARQDSIGAYVLDCPEDPTRLNEFLKLMVQHKIKTYQLSQQLDVEGTQYSTASSVIIPVDQSQYRLINGIMKTYTSFTDSVFYDVSSWTLPLTFNLDYSALPRNSYDPQLLGSLIDEGFLTEKKKQKKLTFAQNYIMEWDEYYAPKALVKILEKGYACKVAIEPFSIKQKGEEKKFLQGSVLITETIDSNRIQSIKDDLESIALDASITILPFSSSKELQRISKKKFKSITKPSLGLIVGSGVSSYESGEVWHLLDQRYEHPPTLLDQAYLETIELKKYTVLIMVDGNYNYLSKKAIQKIKKWVSRGGTLIATRKAVNWCLTNGLSTIQKKLKPKAKNKKVISTNANQRGSMVIGGAICNVQLDLSHPITFGYRKAELAIFKKGTSFFTIPNNRKFSPIIFPEEPLISGYISDRNLAQLKNSTAAHLNSYGAGKVISLVENPNFRAIWFGTNKLFANAIYFNQLMEHSTMEKAEIEIVKKPNSKK